LLAFRRLRRLGEGGRMQSRNETGMPRWFVRARDASFAHANSREFFGDYCFRKTRWLVMAFLLALGREALLATIYASLRFYTGT